MGKRKQISAPWIPYNLGRKPIELTLQRHYIFSSLILSKKKAPVATLRQELRVFKHTLQETSHSTFIPPSLKPVTSLDL